MSNDDFNIDIVIKDVKTPDEFVEFNKIVTTKLDTVDTEFKKYVSEKEALMKSMQKEIEKIESEVRHIDQNVGNMRTILESQETDITKKMGNLRQKFINEIMLSNLRENMPDVFFTKYGYFVDDADHYGRKYLVSSEMLYNLSNLFKIGVIITKTDRPKNKYRCAFIIEVHDNYKKCIEKLNIINDYKEHLSYYTIAEKYFGTIKEAENYATKNKHKFCEEYVYKLMSFIDNIKEAKTFSEMFDFRLLPYTGCRIDDAEIGYDILHEMVQVEKYKVIVERYKDESGRYNAPIKLDVPLITITFSDGKLIYENASERVIKEMTGFIKHYLDLINL